MDRLTDLFNKCFNNQLIFDCNGSKGYVVIYEFDFNGEVKIITYGSLKKEKPESELKRMHQDVEAYLNSKLKENVG